MTFEAIEPAVPTTMPSRIPWKRNGSFGKYPKKSGLHDSVEKGGRGEEDGW